VSRVGQKAIPLPSGVAVQVAGQDLKAKGPKGELALTLVDEVSATVDEGQVKVLPRDKSKRSRMMWGMQRALISNMVAGVSEGFTIELDIVGVGYRAAVQGKNLTLQLGYSHEVVYPIPEGITIACERPTAIAVSGIDRQKVGQVAAEIRAFRSPEPYKGKGIKYVNEYIFRKEGKKK
jgi:large subunit ribosomal protein L6